MNEKLKELNSTFVIKGKEYESQLEEDLEIDRNNLNEEFVKHPQIFAWYATAYELAAEYERKLETQLERLYANLDYEVRVEHEAAKLKKTTEKMVENTIITRPEYVALQEKLVEAKKHTSLLKVAKDAMIHKKEMLISLGANFREELKSNPYLKNQ